MSKERSQRQTLRSDISHNVLNVNRNSFFFISIIFLIAVLVGSFFIFEIKKFEKEISEISRGQISISFKKPPKVITLFFVGDIMLDRGVEFMVNKYGEKDWRFPFLEITDDLKTADILFGNLEGPISDKGIKVGSIYSFRADPEAIEGLSFAGFDILSVANNHIFDYGREAMEDTFLRLKEAGIDYVGGGFNEIEAYSPLIKVIRSPTSAMGLEKVKVAFLAYTNLGSKYWAAKGDHSGIAWLTKERLARDIMEAKNQADIIVISMHFGEEYQSLSTPEQKFFARSAIDSGADLVVGHHPHVIQEIEKYNEGYIAYSLGNFVFDQGFSKETMRGLLLKVIVADGKIKEVVPIEIQINEFFQPEVIGD